MKKAIICILGSLAMMSVQAQEKSNKKLIIVKEQKQPDPSEKEDELKQIEKQKAEREKIAKEKEGMERSRAEDLAAEKAELDKKEAKRKEKEKQSEEAAKEKEIKRKANEAGKGTAESTVSIPDILEADKYKELITKADNYFKSKQYKEAKVTYSDALKIKANDPYAKGRISEIEKLNNGK